MRPPAPTEAAPLPVVPHAPAPKRSPVRGRTSPAPGGPAMSPRNPFLRLLTRAFRPRPQPAVRRQPNRIRRAVEGLEDRVVPAIQLTYGGAGTALTLSD